MPHHFFSLASAAAMLGWAILIFAPKSKAAQKLIYEAWLPILFSVLYVAALASNAFSNPPAGGGFGSIHEVRTLFASNWALLAGWVHYLAFDLYIGGILSKKMADDRFSPYVRGPVLLFTFILGPSGFLAYHLVRAARGR